MRSERRVRSLEWVAMPQVESTPTEPRPVPAREAGDDAGAAPDPLASLKKMSTTAGVGSQEYVAVNPGAGAALRLGVASLLVSRHDVLLLIPAAGVVCAIVAWRQISNS